MSAWTWVKDHKWWVIGGAGGAVVLYLLLRPGKASVPDQGPLFLPIGSGGLSSFGEASVGQVGQTSQTGQIYVVPGPAGSDLEAYLKSLGAVSPQAADDFYRFWTARVDWLKSNVVMVNRAEYSPPGPAGEDLTGVLKGLARLSPGLADTFYAFWTARVQQFWDAIKPLQAKVGSLESALDALRAQYDKAIKDLDIRTGQKLFDLEERVSYLEAQGKTSQPPPKGASQTTSSPSVH
jgi:hypothetical protein